MYGLRFGNDSAYVVVVYLSNLSIDQIYPSSHAVVTAEIFGQTI